MGEFYVYVYLDTRKPGNYNYSEYFFEYEPFYVGKGKRYRYRKHLYKNSKNHSNKYLISKIKKIQKETHKHPIIFKIKNNLTENDAFLLEKKLIKIIGKKSEKGPLCNITEGGDGISGYKHSEKTKQKMKDFWKEHYKNPEAHLKISKGLKNSEIWKNVIHSDEYRKKMSDIHLDPNGKFQQVVKTKEFKDACRLSKIGELNPSFGKTGEKSYHYNKGLKIYKFSLDGTLINEYENSIRAEEDNPGTDRSTITGRCKGKRNKHYRGYLYSFEKEKNGFFKSLKLDGNNYIVIDNNDNELVFTKMNHLIKHFKLSRFAIKEYLKNSNKV